MSKRRTKKRFQPAVDPPAAAATNRFVPSAAYLASIAAAERLVSAPPLPIIQQSNLNTTSARTDNVAIQQNGTRNEIHPLGQLSSLIPSSSQPERARSDNYQPIATQLQLDNTDDEDMVIQNQLVQNASHLMADEEESSGPPSKRVRLLENSEQSAEGGEGEKPIISESTGLGDFSKVYEFIKTGQSPLSQDRLASRSGGNLNSPTPTLGFDMVQDSKVIVKEYPPAVPIPSHSRYDTDTAQSSIVPRTSYERLNSVEPGAPLVPALPYSPTVASTSKLGTSTKSVYVRPIDAAASSRVSHQRFENSNPSFKLLSQSEKVTSLPRKLESAFPNDNDMLLDKIYTPPSMRLDKRIPPPIESTLFGFWSGPPKITGGKGLYPAPVHIPSDRESEVLEKRRRVDIFIDNSNVMYCFLNWLRLKMEGSTKGISTLMLEGNRARFDYATFFAILERGRKVEKRVLVASSPLQQGLESAIDWGYEVSVLQRVPRADLNANAEIRKIPAQPATATSPAIGPTFIKEHPIKFREQGVDELIHLKMLESLLDHTPSPTSPRPLLVLATGDANGSEYNPSGFLGCIRKGLERGWDVEVVAFPHGTSAIWFTEEMRAGELADSMGEGVAQRGRLKVIDLEYFGDELVS